MDNFDTEAWVNKILDLEEGEKQDNITLGLCFLNSKPEESLLLSKYITEMIQFCIPEVDMKLVNNPILCSECYDKLEQMLKFKKKCLEVQDNLKQMLLKNSAFEVDLNAALPNKDIPSSFGTSADTQTSDCQSDNLVSKNNECNEHSEISNRCLTTICDQTIIFSESIFSVKNEVIASTSYDGNSSNTNLKHTSPECGKGLAKSGSSKIKIVKNVLDVKFTKRYCNACKLSFQSLAELIFHLYSEHQKEGELYICLLCRYKSEKLSLLMKHYSTFHSKCADLDATCFFCFTDKENFEDLFKHMSEKHRNNCKWGKYFCNSCDFISRSYMNFRKHFFQSHDLICNYCLRYSDNFSALNKHLRNHFSTVKRRTTVEPSCLKLDNQEPTSCAKI